MITIGVVTVARSDYGLYVPLLRTIEADPGSRLLVFVSGAHLAPEFGLTVRNIESDGFPIAARVDVLLSSPSAEGVGKSIGLGVIGFAETFARNRPDLLVVLGDRFEMYSAALAALPFAIPVAHIHGGEITEGAIDDALRHSLTKLAHLHFVTTEEHGRRVRQLGEEPWRVTVAGAPAIDAIQLTAVTPAAVLRKRWGLDSNEPLLAVTFHPVTLQAELVEQHIGELLAALAHLGHRCVFTGTNADRGNDRVRRALGEFIAAHPSAIYCENLGAADYWGLLQTATAMVGNSSTGLIEAPSFELPVVNVGDRQRGRTRGINVIDVPCERRAIAAGLERAMSGEFRRFLRGMISPYGRGGTAALIHDTLKSVPLDERLLLKRFVDWREVETTVTS